MRTESQTQYDAGHDPPLDVKRRLNSARVLVISMLFAPCGAVGGKRFSFLSRYLSKRFVEYHVLARNERDRYVDQTAFDGPVNRVRAWIDYPIRARRGVRYKLMRAWERWFCVIDPYIGWVPPAVLKGVQLCLRRRLNVIVVTVPLFSPMISALVIAAICRAKLIIDYRDPMTGVRRDWPKPFGKSASRALERTAIRRARAIVFCTNIMHDQFVAEFGGIAPRRLEVIYNGFLGFESDGAIRLDAGRIEMVYAGEFYGSRRLNMIAPILRELLDAGEISPESFRFHIYSNLRREDRDYLRTQGIGGVVEEHPVLPYDEIKKVLRGADILFLPSGDDVAYAVPFKFFDYVSARRPILAVAPLQSSVAQLMGEIDCGEFAGSDDPGRIREALQRLLRRDTVYSFAGAERYLWSNAAAAYSRVIESVASE